MGVLRAIEGGVHDDVGHTILCFPNRPCIDQHIQGGENWVYVDQVAFNLVQIELQAYESLMSTRTLLQGVIDFDPRV
jgi:hypothetical protein